MRICQTNRIQKKKKKKLGRIAMLKTEEKIYIFSHIRYSYHETPKL